MIEFEGQPEKVTILEKLYNNLLTLEEHSNQTSNQFDLTRKSIVFWHKVGDFVVYRFIPFMGLVALAVIILT
jgi:hypothetical protein